MATRKEGREGANAAVTFFLLSQCCQYNGSKGTHPYDNPHSSMAEGWSYWSPLCSWTGRPWEVAAGSGGPAPAASAVRSGSWRFRWGTTPASCWSRLPQQEKHVDKHSFRSQMQNHTHRSIEDRRCCPWRLFTLCFYVVHAHRLGVGDQVRQRSRQPHCFPPPGRTVTKQSQCKSNECKTIKRLRLSN